MVFDHVSGPLPDGIVLSSDGELTGTPTEVGVFEFEVRVYSIYDGWGTAWDSDSVDYDDEWFTLVVTEASTNEDCPAPDDETTSETYVCAGTVSATTVALDEAVEVDVNWFFDFDEGKDYNIDTIDFTLSCDSTYWALDSDELNSQLLREAVSEANPNVSFDSSTAGQLRVVFTAGEDDDFNVAGRIMNINFYAVQDVPAGEYPLTITLNEIASGSDDETLPTSIAIDGSITVEESIVTEESTSETETTEEIE